MEYVNLAARNARHVLDFLNLIACLALLQNNCNFKMVALKGNVYFFALQGISGILMANARLATVVAEIVRAQMLGAVFPVEADCIRTHIWQLKAGASYSANVRC